MMFLVVQARSSRWFIINETQQSWHAEVRGEFLAIQALKPPG
jgi:hypothetical protein